MREKINKINMFFEWLAKSLAILGAIMLSLIGIMVLISIIGRALIPFGFSSIKGDFEIVEFGVAFAVFSFMPYAQLTRAHAEVSFISERFSIKINKIINLIADSLIFLIASLLTWRMNIGAIEKFYNGETSFILQIPLYLAYSLSLFALYIWVFIAGFIIIRDLLKLMRAKFE